MLVRGKGRQFDRVPVPVDVGEAIVTWLCNGRKGNSRHLFVCVGPPYAPFTSSGPVRSALCKAYRRAGLVPPDGQARTHALRHGLAMALLDRGSSLGEIGDVLRHRSARSTTAYARYDHGQQITKASAEHNFVRVGQETGLRERQPSGRRGTGPRLHDLRHTMAVRTLVDWYRSGLDPDREMYKLSAWLGHGSPDETYWYIEAVPELLHLATERAERATTGGKRHEGL